MVNKTRRFCMVGVGSAAAAALMRPVPSGARATALPPAGVQRLIAQERARILAALASDDIPGAAVCLLHQGKCVWVEGFGETDRKSHRHVGSGTIFSIQSTSKNFTATAIMLTVQRGLLHLDKPITEYIPKFTVQSRFESMPQVKMTLRLLLSHRAGFTHEASIGNNYDCAFPDFNAHIQSISQTWLRYPVGERYRYSNLGVDLAGYILQTVMRTPFADCLRSLIFEPLGMDDSTAATEVYAQRADRALGHEQGYASVPLKTPLIPSGGIYTSAGDMISYLAFHLGRGQFGDKRLLDESLWNEMHSFSLGGDYGLGVNRTERRYGDTPVRMLEHKGGGFGFGCVCNYCPEAQLAWVALFNRPTAASYQFGTQLLDNLLTHRFGVRRPRFSVADLSPVQLQRSQLELLTGNYLGRNSSANISFEHGILGLRVASVFAPLQFISPVDLYIATPGGEAVTYRYFSAGYGEAAHLECSIGENSLDYNDGPSDGPGPNSASWDSIIGEYRIEQWGKRAQSATVHRKNGYLYLNEERLIEFEPNLFFTADGEAVDFRQAKPTWRNILLQRA